MPLPRWLARINKRFFNPREIRRGVRPVLIHVGRSSAGTKTPVGISDESELLQVDVRRSRR